MRHYKRRRAAMFARICVLALFPITVAGGIHGTNGIKKALNNRADFEINKMPHSSVSADRNDTYTGVMVKPDGELFADTVISHGYGLVAETDDSNPLLKLKSPLYMISDAPGEKPYPSEGEWSEGGAVIRTTYREYSGATFFDLDNGGQVNNKSTLSNDELLRESRCLPCFTITDTSAPQVLIYHTHTTESFEPYVRESYDPNFNYRTTDETKNMIMVGDAIEAELEAQGIGVIHVKTIHDYPSYNGSYGRSRESILPILEQNPSIKVVLDIHRDAISGEGTAYQPYVEINGREAAQVMIISGCDDGTLGMPNYMKNFRFAAALQQKLESDCNGLTRPILFDYRHYNQDLTTGSLLIEVGSHGNTLEQAQYSGQLIGHSLGELLCSMKE